MTRAGLLLMAAAVAGAAPVSASSVPANPAQTPLPSFVEIGHGPAGGTIWQGVIRNSAYPHSSPPSLVYFPPSFSAPRRDPALYALHGVRGRRYSIAHSLRFV